MWQFSDFNAPARRNGAVTALAILAFVAGGVQSVSAGVESFKGSPVEDQAAPAPAESKEASKEADPAPAAPVVQKTPESAQAPRPTVRSWTRTVATPTPAAPEVAPESFAATTQQTAQPASAARAEPQRALMPGSGFASPTIEPQSIVDLNAPGASAKAIAHWNMIPEDLYIHSRGLGVVAFHINGIDRVEFSLNGGPWLASTEMTRNVYSQTWEYVAPFDVSLVPDGPIELRAIAYPTVGQPRLLESMTLVANSQGSIQQYAYYVSPTGDDANGDGSAQKPFATIWKAASKAETVQGAPYYASNCSVLLMPGDHLYAGKPSTSPRVRTGTGWFTIAAAPGVSRDRVRITGNSSASGALFAGRVKFQNLTLHSAALKANHNDSAAAWFDRCDLIGTGPTDTTQFASASTWKGGSFFTNCNIRNLTNGPVHARVLRGCTLEGLGSDAFHNPRLVVNCKVNGLRKPSGTAYHPDLFQFYGVFDNVIVYGVEAREVYGQGIFSRGLDGIADKNIAFVNVAIDQRSHLSQWLQSCDHLLFWNVTLLGRDFVISNAGSDPRNELSNVSIRDSVFQNLRVDPNIITPSQQPTVFQNNHFVTGVMLGSRASGGPCGVDPNGPRDPFLPPASSPLANRVTNPLAPADVKGQERGAHAAIGAVDTVN